MDRVGLFTPHRARQHVEQARPVHGEIGKAVALDRYRPEIEQLPGLAGVPQADFLALGLAGERLQDLTHTERVEHARAVRGELHAGADFLQLRRLLVDLDVDAALEQGQRRRESADAAAGDQNTGLAGHGAELYFIA